MSTKATAKPEKALGDALRFSLWLFQGLIILGLIFYLGAGLFTVPEGSVGLVLVNGRLTTDGEGRARVHESGTHITMPPPLGKVVIIPGQALRQIETQAFVAGLGAEDRLALLRRRSSLMNRLLVPGRDGYLLCGDGAVIHVVMRATYSVRDAVAYYKAFGLDAGKEKKVLSHLFESAIVREGLSLRPLEMDDVKSGLTAFAGRVQAHLAPLFLARGLLLRDGGVALVEKRNPLQVADAFQRGQDARANSDSKIDAAKAEKKMLLGATPDAGTSQVATQARKILARAQIDAEAIVEKARRDATRTRSLAAAVKAYPGLKQSLFLEMFRTSLKDLDVRPLLMHPGKREFRMKLLKPAGASNTGTEVSP